MIITEETLRADPNWIPLLMCLPADSFWQLAAAAEIFISIVVILMT